MENHSSAPLFPISLYLSVSIFGFSVAASINPLTPWREDRKPYRERRVAKVPVSINVGPSISKLLQKAKFLADLETITSDSMAEAQSSFQDEGTELLERPPITGSDENDTSLVVSPSYEDSTMTRWKLYGSHFLSAWGERMWEFAIGLVRYLPYNRKLKKGGSLCLTKQGFVLRRYC